LAGFGAAAKKGAAKPKASKKGAKKAAPKKALSPKRQWDVYTELVSAGATPATVYAQLPDSKWIDCGEVAVEAPGTIAQAAQMHKRLILEHAVRCNPGLTPRKTELVCGISGSDDEPVALEKVDVPEKLRSGYKGTPDESSGYYCFVGAASEGFTGNAKKAGMGGF